MSLFLVLAKISHFHIRISFPHFLPPGGKISLFTVRFSLLIMCLSSRSLISSFYYFRKKCYILYLLFTINLLFHFIKYFYNSVKSPHCSNFPAIEAFHLIIKDFCTSLLCTVITLEVRMESSTHYWCFSWKEESLPALEDITNEWKYLQ